MKVFLDTNALIHFFNQSSLQITSDDIQIYTFEKCVYEFNNGIKKALLDREFLLKSLKHKLDIKNLYFSQRIADQIIQSTIKDLEFTSNNIYTLSDQIKTYNLKFEFGTAEEHLFYQQEIENDAFLVKKFFEKAKEKLIKTLSDIEKQFERKGIQVILYEEVFFKSTNIVDFRFLLKDSLLPSEDLEIIFSAIAKNCKYFVTEDGKNKKGVHQSKYTLGVNEVLEFITVDQLEQKIASAG